MFTLSQPVSAHPVLPVIVCCFVQYGAARYYASHTKTEYVTNEEVRAKIQQAIGPREDLLTTLKRRKLQWNGHV